MGGRPLAEIEIVSPDQSIAIGTSPPGGLHRQLSSLGVLLLTLSSLSPVVSIFGMGADVVQHTGGGAATLFMLGLGAALLWGLVYAELGSAYPYAGGDYVGVGSILGGWAGLATLTLWVVITPPSIAFSAQTFAVYFGGLTPGIPRPAVVYGGLVVCLGVALMSVRSGAWITGLFLSLETAAVLALLLVGLSHPHQNLLAVMAHPVAPGPGGALLPVALGALAIAGVNTAYATVGGNQAIAFGEELADPHRRMGGVIVLAALGGGVAIALPVLAVVWGAKDLGALARSSSPFALFLATRLGNWAAVALNVGVAVSVFNATIVTVMVGARLLFSLGRDRLLPLPLSRMLTGVSAQSGTPRAATLVITALAAACCLLPSHTLLVIMSGLMVYGWSLVCLAVLVGRRKGLTGRPGYWRSPLFPLAPLLGLLMAGAFVAADLMDADAGRPSLIILGAAVLGAVLWYYRVLKRRPGGWTPSLGERADRA